MNNPEDLDLKNKRITVRPSPTSSVITLVMSILFLIFGLVFMGSVLGEAEAARGPMTFFLVIWIAACLGMAIYSLVNLSSYGKSKPNPAALEVLEVEDRKTPDKKEGSEKARPDFGTRLRELEALKKDGLLTEEEYQRKRREIIEEKW
ncbi:MAG: SHOCT domain-containing protein [Candidatus Saccharicenans sp.]|nr:SHOCT domain-containing protein [Candidatus Saccharicenans sp.]